MKIYNNLKHFVACILVISVLFSPLSFLITEATEGYQNLTDSYNCYAYAINRVDELDNNVRFYNNTQTEKLYQPGDISKDIYNSFGFDPNISYETMVSLIKCNVISDLYAMGHTDVSLYYYDDSVDYEEGYDYYDFYNELIDTTNFFTHELICFRVGPADYHFMRYDNATESWYNKNGYNPIFKYTDNNGIPANNIAWIGTNTYDSDIIYVKYNKLQFDVNQSGFFSGTITVKGGADDSNTTLYCCGDSCCNPTGICTCESEVINKGKDAVYEIVFSTSGTYYIQLSTEAVVSNFNYIIYAYNMYNGNYQILTQGNGNSTNDIIENVNLTAYDDYNNSLENWQYQAYRYYLRLDFGKINISDVAVNVNVFHDHEYTDHYEQAT